MEVANRIVAEVLVGVKERVQPGVETRELDELAEEMCRQHKVEPAFKGYRGYPCCICISVNEEIVHGIPGSRRIKAGDLVSLDFGVKYQGYYGDAAVTVAVGEVAPRARTVDGNHRRGAVRRASTRPRWAGASRTSPTRCKPWWRAPVSG